MIFIWKHDKEKDNPNAVAPTDAAAGNLLDDKLPDKVHHSVSVVAFTCFEHGYAALSKQLKKSSHSLHVFMQTLSLLFTDAHRSAGPQWSKHYKILHS